MEKLKSTSILNTLFEENKINSGTTWIIEENPLYSCKCPKCGYCMFMSRESLIKRLIKWAKMLKDII